MTEPLASGGGAPAPVGERASAASLSDGEWHRLHPATPLLRGGFGLIFVVGAFFTFFRDRLIGLFVPREWNTQQDDEVVEFVIDQVMWVALGAVGVIAIITFAAWLSWRVHRFRITGDQVEVTEGIVFRKHRRAPLSRIQSINIKKPLLARLLGACRLEIQQAGSDASVDLAYLRGSVAESLRREILHRASGRGGDAADEGGPSQSRVGRLKDEFLRPDADIAALAPDSLVRISVPRVIASSLLGGWLVAGVLYGVAALVLVLGAQQYWALFTILPAGIAAVLGGVKAVGSKLRYSIAATGDGIRLAYGLLSTTVENLPPGRVFAMQVRQPLLWRPFGWWQVRFTRAGDAASADSSSGQQNSALSSLLLPVGDISDVRTVIGLVVPDLAQSSLILEGLTGQAPDSFVVSPPRARVFRWFSVRRNGFAVHDAAFMLRTGRVWRSLEIVPSARVQSLAIKQGPVEGMLRLGGVQFHVPGAILSPSLGALEQSDTALLFDHANRVVKAAIANDSSESWAAALTRNAVLPEAAMPAKSRTAAETSPGDGQRG